MLNGYVFFGKASQQWRGVVEYQGIKKTQLFSSKELAEHWVAQETGR